MAATCCRLGGQHGARFALGKLPCALYRSPRLEKILCKIERRRRQPQPHCPWSSLETNYPQFWFTVGDLLAPTKLLIAVDYLGPIMCE